MRFNRYYIVVWVVVGERWEVGRRS